MSDQVNEKNRPEPPPIIVVSGGIGASGEQLARTVLAQFEGVHVPLKIIPRVRHVDQLAKIVEEAVGTNATILHTMVDPVLRAEIIRLVMENQVCAIDMVGPLLDCLSAILGQEPLGKPGLYRELHSTYFKRMDAIEFTLNHDDGMRPEGWQNAEIMLLGPSRVGKTPTSVFLSMMGWKVANLPLVPNVPPRSELFDLEPHRVVGLTIDPSQLIFHRRHRRETLALARKSTYTDPEKILDEIQQAEALYQRHRFPSIDVTGKPIETSAGEIMRLVSRRQAVE
jgi:regulator of PEP synthase PpsR (kinase-PPPase family)